MNAAIQPRKHRPRRIASDEAHAWARNLRLGNPHAKFVLCMLTGYVNGEGSCFVSIGHLAEDCELVENTVRRRLAFLEEIGALVRVPQWVDEAGRRNGDGRGRRTTDEIRLLIDADIDEIEAKARGNGEEPPHDSPSPDPAPHEGSNPVSPALGVHLPCTSVHPLISEPEPEESPPNPPPGGLDEAGRKRFQEFKTNYPDGIIDVGRAELEYEKLAESDQAACNAAVLTYADRCRKRREKSMKAHLFIRKRAWDGLLATPETAAAPSLHEPGGTVGRALLTLAQIANSTPFFRVGDGRISYRGEITPRLVAMAKTPPDQSWPTYQSGSPNYAAWRDFFAEVFPGKSMPRLREICVPWPWPPKADGTTYSLDSPPPLVPGTLLTEDDLQALSK